MLDFALQNKWQNIINQHQPYRENKRSVRLASQSICNRFPLMYRNDNGRLETTQYVEIRSNGNYATFHGLANCHNQWTCPICAPRNAIANMHKTNSVLSWQKKQGRDAFMATFTVPHHYGEGANTVYQRLRRSWHKFQNNRTWKRIKKTLGIIGFIRGTECTYTPNGFHFHFHVIFICRHNIQEILQYEEEIRHEWLHCTLFIAKAQKAKLNYSPEVYEQTQPGFIVSKNAQARVRSAYSTDYMYTDCGLDRSHLRTAEITNLHMKEVHEGSRHMFDLLASDDPKDNDLFYEYALVTAGQQRIRISIKLLQETPYEELTPEEIWERLTKTNTQKKIPQTVAFITLSAYFKILELEIYYNYPIRRLLLYKACAGFESIAEFCRMFEIPPPIKKPPDFKAASNKRKKFYLNAA